MLWVSTSVPRANKNLHGEIEFAIAATASQVSVLAPTAQVSIPGAQVSVSPTKVALP